MNAGKGDRPRSVDKKVYDNNYKKIFSRKGYQGYQGYQERKGGKIFKKTY